MAKVFGQVVPDDFLGVGVRDQGQIHVAGAVRDVSDVRHPDLFRPGHRHPRYQVLVFAELVAGVGRCAVRFLWEHQHVVGAEDVEQTVPPDTDTAKLPSEHVMEFATSDARHLLAHGLHQRHGLRGPAAAPTLAPYPAVIPLSACPEQPADFTD